MNCNSYSKLNCIKKIISVSLCAAIVLVSPFKSVLANTGYSDERIVIDSHDADTGAFTENEVIEIICDVSEASEKYAAESATVSITAVKGYEEGAYVKWTPVDGADGYVVYCSNDSSSFTKAIDDMLIRNYGSYYRADEVGLPAGDYYFKIDAVKVNSETKEQTVIASAISEKASVIKYDRSGYAFIEKDGSPYMNGSVGAYNADGTLKDDAVIIYISEWNKNDVKVKIKNGTESYRECTGILNILSTIGSGYETRPIDIRVIGCLTDPDGIDSSSSGDLTIANKSKGTPITLEGIGDDATFNGFGIVLTKCNNVEVRNMAVINCNSKEGDNFSINNTVSNVWMHNNDSFYGEPGGDSDQKKGDGAMDCKRADFVTLSYNHFFDNGKCNLLSVSSDDKGHYITYHHNWYDHSDSRHPRARYYSVHTYNNYFDHNGGYAMAATLGASIFAENNYFENVNRPFLIASQGHDIESGDKTDSSTVTSTLSKESGGFIKEYGNVFVNSGSKYNPYDPVECPYDFDAYKASSKDEKVPDTVKVNHIQDESDKYSYYTNYGVTDVRTYNNFDTEGLFYAYTPDPAENVPEIVKAHAGRVDGGDFKYTLGASADDSGIVQDLKNKLLAYKTSLVTIGGIEKTDEIKYYTVTFDFNGGENNAHATSTKSTVLSGKKVSKPSVVPVKEGYSFVRWNDEEGVPYDFDAPVHSDIKLIAEWSEITDISDTDKSLKLDMKDVPVKDKYDYTFTKHGFTVMATQNYPVSVSSSDKVVEGNRYTHKLSLGGTGDIGEGYRAIKFTISKKSKLIVVAESASATLQSNRPLVVTDKNNEIVLKNFTPDDYAPGRFTEELEAGTWYLYSRNSSVNIYYIEINDSISGGTDNPNPELPKEVDVNAIDNADGSKTIGLTEGLIKDKAYGSKDAVVFTVMENMPYSTVEAVAYGDKVYPGFVQGTTNTSIKNNIPTSGAVLVINTGDIKSGVVKIILKSPYTSSAKKIYAVRTAPTYAVVEEKNFTTKDNYCFNIDVEKNCQYMLYGSGTKPFIADITYTYSDKDASGENPGVTPEPTPGEEPGQEKEPEIKTPFVAVFEATGSCEYVTEYDGIKKEPKMLVTDASGNELILGSDYTVKYANNIKATEGLAKKATVTISGKGLYKGNKVLTFDIEKKDIEASDIISGYVEAKPHTNVKPVLAYNGVILKTTDYNISDNAGKLPENIVSGQAYSYTVTGNGNFKGSKKLECNIVESIEAKKFVIVQKKNSFTYNAASLFNDIITSFEVFDATDKSKSAPLTLGRDFIISISDGVNEENATSVGKYSVAVVGIGEYTGAAAKSVNVTQNKLNTFEVSDIAAKKYLAAGVTISENEIEVKDTVNNVVLKQGVDYVISYANNKASSDTANGKLAKAKISFVGNYKGCKSVSKDFVIEKADINEVDLYATDMIYTKPGIYKAALFAQLDNVKLASNEYAVSYYLEYDENDLSKCKPMDAKNKLELAGDETEKEVIAVITSKNKNVSEGTKAVSFKVKKQTQDMLDLSKLKVTIYDKNISAQKGVSYVEYAGAPICLEDMSDYSEINNKDTNSRYYIDIKIQKKNKDTGKSEWVSVNKADLSFKNINNLMPGQMNAVISAESDLYAGAKVCNIKIQPKQMSTFN